MKQKPVLINAIQTPLSLTPNVMVCFVSVRKVLYFFVCGKIHSTHFFLCWLLLLMYLIMLLLWSFNHLILFCNLFSLWFSFDFYFGLTWLDLTWYKIYEPWTARRSNSLHHCITNCKCANINKWDDEDMKTVSLASQFSNGFCCVELHSGSLYLCIVMSRLIWGEMILVWYSCNTQCK